MLSFYTGLTAAVSLVIILQNSTFSVLSGLSVHTSTTITTLHTIAQARPGGPSCRMCDVSLPRSSFLVQQEVCGRERITVSEGARKDSLSHPRDSLFRPSGKRVRKVDK